MRPDRFAVLLCKGEASIIFEVTSDWETRRAKYPRRLMSPWIMEDRKHAAKYRMEGTLPKIGKKYAVK